MSEKQLFTPAAASMAATQCISSLVALLTAKNLITVEDANYVFAVAASASRGAGDEEAARLIEAVIPTAKGFDAVAHAKSLGAVIEEK